MAEKRNVIFIIFFGGAALLTVFLITLYFMIIYFNHERIAIGECIAVVDIHGEIGYDRSKITELESYRENDRVRAVILHIDSPGGDVGASQEIYHAVCRLRAEKPIVAYLANTAASGAYYIACAADSIVALEGTLTGSIGAIAAFIHADELLRKVGLNVTIVKSGKYKDVGSLYRQMTEEERQLIGGVLDSVYDQFLRVVCEGRRMPLEKVRELAEGRLYSGEAAKEHGLVDRIGSYEDAIALASALGGIEGKPKILQRRPRKRRLIDLLFGMKTPYLPLAGEDYLKLKYIIP